MVTNLYPTYSNLDNTKLQACLIPFEVGSDDLTHVPGTELTITKTGLYLVTCRKNFFGLNL